MLTNESIEKILDDIPIDGSQPLSEDIALILETIATHLNRHHYEPDVAAGLRKLASDFHHYENETN